MAPVWLANKAVVASIFLIAFVFAISHASVAEPVPGGDTIISSVTVEISVNNRMPEAVTARISSAVRLVGEKALVGKSVEDAKDLEESLLVVMKKIFSEVLSGFTVDDISLRLDKQTVVSIRLAANEPCVRSVRIDVIPPQGISPFWNETLSRGMNAVADDIARAINGLPVESESWSEPLIRDMVLARLDLTDRFPGFQVDAFLDMDQVVSVKLWLKPADKIIRHVSVKMRSSTMPSMAIEGLKFDLARRVDLLLGLPVVFAVANQDFIATELHDYLNTMDYSRKLRLNFDIRFALDGNSLVSVVAESRSYSAFARLKVSLGQEFRNPDLEGHVGVFPIKDTELFTEFNFLPGPLELQFNLGAGRRLGRLNFAAGRNIVDGLNRAWFTWNMTEDIIISLEKNVIDDKKRDVEGSLMFRAHDFFSVELASDMKDKIWVRFNANL